MTFRKRTNRLRLMEGSELLEPRNLLSATPQSAADGGDSKGEKSDKGEDKGHEETKKEDLQDESKQSEHSQHEKDSESGHDQDSQTEKDTGATDSGNDSKQSESEDSKRADSEDSKNQSEHEKQNSDGDTESKQENPDQGKDSSNNEQSPDQAPKQKENQSTDNAQEQERQPETGDHESSESTPLQSSEVSSSPVPEQGSTDEPPAPTQLAEDQPEQQNESTSREHAPGQQKEGTVREHAPGQQKDGTGREHAPGQQKEGTGREHAPGQQKDGTGREHAPGQQKDGTGREHAPGQQKDGTGREHAPGQQKDGTGREHAPGQLKKKDNRDGDSNSPIDSAQSSRDTGGNQAEATLSAFGSASPVADITNSDLPAFSTARPLTATAPDTPEADSSTTSENEIDSGADAAADPEPEEIKSHQQLNKTQLNETRESFDSMVTEQAQIPQEPARASSTIRHSIQRTDRSIRTADRSVTQADKAIQQMERATETNSRALQTTSRKADEAVRSASDFIRTAVQNVEKFFDWIRGRESTQPTPPARELVNNQVETNEHSQPERSSRSTEAVPQDRQNGQPSTQTESIASRRDADLPTSDLTVANTGPEPSVTTDSSPPGSSSNQGHKELVASEPIEVTNNNAPSKTVQSTQRQRIARDAASELVNAMDLIAISQSQPSGSVATATPERERTSALETINVFNKEAVVQKEAQREADERGVKPASIRETTKDVDTDSKTRQQFRDDVQVAKSSKLNTVERGDQALDESSDTSRSDSGVITAAPTIAKESDRPPSSRPLRPVQSATVPTTPSVAPPVGSALYVQDDVTGEDTRDVIADSAGSLETRTATWVAVTTINDYTTNDSGLRQLANLSDSLPSLEKQTKEVESTTGNTEPEKNNTRRIPTNDYRVKTEIAQTETVKESSRSTSVSLASTSNFKITKSVRRSSVTTPSDSPIYSLSQRPEPRVIDVADEEQPVPQEASAKDPTLQKTDVSARRPDVEGNQSNGETCATAAGLFVVGTLRIGQTSERERHNKKPQPNQGTDQHRDQR